MGRLVLSSQNIHTKKVTYNIVIFIASRKDLGEGHSAYQTASKSILRDVELAQGHVHEDVYHEFLPGDRQESRWHCQGHGVDERGDGY